MGIFFLENAPGYPFLEQLADYIEQDLNPDLSGKPAAQPYNLRRNQSRPFGTSSQLMEYDFSPLVGLRQSFTRRGHLKSMGL